MRFDVMRGEDESEEHMCLDVRAVVAPVRMELPGKGLFRLLNTSRDQTA
ncbi:hypothetical protein [Amycolatopsis sp. PS_44_ISF1]|nr:hypothetical protein [Amycolatopsis sp. PS_44_ISF1]MDT8909338.1 hypothetical protein [Amycolatopsis sp. PS_44_ISF1]